MTNNPIPPDIQPFLNLYQPTPAPDDWKILNALETAINAIKDRIRIDRKYLIVLGQSPLSFPVGDTSSLNCTLGNDVIGLTMENIVYLDCQKLQCRPPEETAAIVLEELVHCLMNVKDEDIVKQIVCLLYPQASYDHVQGYYRTPDMKDV